MKDLIESLKNYLHEALNVSIDIRPWKNLGNLPLFLSDAYEFFKFSIFEQPCLLMVSKKSAEITPGLISGISRYFATKSLHRLERFMAEGNHDVVRLHHMLDSAQNDFGILYQKLP